MRPLLHKRAQQRTVYFRLLSAAKADAYRTLLAAGLSGNAEAATRAALDAGGLAEAAVRRYKELVERLVGIIVTEASREGPFEFADQRLVAAICDQAASVASDRET